MWSKSVAHRSLSDDLQLEIHAPPAPLSPTPPSLSRVEAWVEWSDRAQSTGSGARALHQGRGNMTGIVAIHMWTTTYYSEGSMKMGSVPVSVPKEPERQREVGKYVAWKRDLRNNMQLSNTMEILEMSGQRKYE